MITLEFTLDEKVLREDLESSPESAEPGVLETTYFVMPVRFAIDDGDMLAFPGAYADWRPLPLLGFATHLHNALRSIEDDGSRQITLAEGGQILLRRDGDEVRISSSILDRKDVSVRYDELLAASGRFLAEVRDLLLKRIPSMQEHPNWSEWFPTPG